MKKFFIRLFGKFNRKRRARIQSLLRAVRQGRLNAEATKAAEAKAKTYRESKTRPYPVHLLVPLEMTMEEYDALPHASEIKAKGINLEKDVPLGFRFRAYDGHVAEIVKGNQMFLHQAGGLFFGLRDREMRHYNPVMELKRPLLV